MAIWLTLLVLNVIVFILEILLGHVFIAYLALTPAYAFLMPWTFITSIFLHGGFLHLFFNMFALLIFAPFLEYKIGSRRFLLLYLVAGIFGNVGYLLTNLGSNIPGLGASGAIFGILGALAVLEPNMIVFVGFMPMTMWMAAAFWIITEFFAMGRPTNIAHSAHLSGIFIGIIYAYALRRRARRILREIY